VFQFVKFIFLGDPENEEQVVLNFFVNGGDFLQNRHQLEIRVLSQFDLESVDFL
jgi:hypothetical protein